ncbi:MAG TPA: Maf family protein [Candidatus Binatia bacterium]|nr:Maf family protein [Candidatus Binatia bacterium]
MAQLILASQSPRRRKLIAFLRKEVRAVTSGVDEESIDDRDPRRNAIGTAELKARAVAARFPQAVVIAADTIVALDGQMLGKPAGAKDAAVTLRMLRGRAHQVHTGLVILQGATGRVERSVCTTDVLMRDYSDKELTRYVKSGDPFDKAGAYAIQHATFNPVAQIQGCYSNVVGLPLCQLCISLRRVGVRTDLDVAEQSFDYRDCATCLGMLSG